MIKKANHNGHQTPKISEGNTTINKDCYLHPDPKQVLVGTREEMRRDPAMFTVKWLQQEGATTTSIQLKRYWSYLIISRAASMLISWAPSAGPRAPQTKPRYIYV